MIDKTTNEIWNKAAAVMVKVGQVPFPVTDTLIEFIQLQITEEQARFILVFEKPTLSIDEIKENTDLPETEILIVLETLMDNGIVSGNPDESTGNMTYTLMALFPGIIEYSLMKGESGEKEQKVAQLMEQIVAEFREGVQSNFDILMPVLKSIPATEEIIPVEKFIPKKTIQVEKTIPTGVDVVITAESATGIIDKYDYIGVTHCYCREARRLVGEPCKITDSSEMCILFGKSAQFAIKYNYAKPISKKDAKKIIREAENSGLVHKIFQSDLNVGRVIDGICSCCKCCCGVFRSFHDGTWPYHTKTSYIAKINRKKCKGSGICIERCPMENIILNEDKIAVLQGKCIGCGICAHFCENDAIDIIITKPRDVFIPISKNQ